MNDGKDQGAAATANVDDAGSANGQPGKAGQPAADGAGAEGQTAAESEGGKPAGGEGAEGNGAGDGEGGDDAADDKAGDEPEGAPESYKDFALPEGLTLDPVATSAFKEAAKADNLSQAQAQKYVDMASGLVERTMKGYQDAAAQRITQWAEQVKTDPVVGGPKYEENIKFALEAVSQFGDPELKQVFEEYGLGNNPALVRAFYRIGKAASEASFVHGRGAEQPAPAGSQEQRLAARIAAEQARGK